MSNFSFSVHHIFQFRFWAYRRNCHAVLRQHATFYPYRITHLKDYQDCSRGSVIVRNGFRIWSRYFHQNAKFYYLQAKYCQHILTYGWDITTSGLEKQTSAILKFFFRFRPWPHPRNRHVVLHQPAKLHPNRSICGGLMTFYLTWPLPRLNTTSGFLIDDVIVFRRSKSNPQPNLVDMAQFTAEISLLPFGKNKRPPYWRRLPVSISTTLPQSAWYSAYIY